jgi:hypothetical protein
VFSLSDLRSAIAPYSKFVAAVVGVAIYVIFRRMGITIPGMDGLVYDLIAGALIVGGTVYQAPANTPNCKRPGK